MMAAKIGNAFFIGLTVPFFVALVSGWDYYSARHDILQYDKKCIPGRISAVS